MSAARSWLGDGGGSSPLHNATFVYGWDDGDQLTCVPEAVEEYTVGHSTITYLNSDREPVVAWAGDVVLQISLRHPELLEKKNSEGAGGKSCLVVLPRHGTGFDARRCRWSTSASRHDEKQAKNGSPSAGLKQSSHSLVLRRI